MAKNFTPCRPILDPEAPTEWPGGSPLIKLCSHCVDTMLDAVGASAGGRAAVQSDPVAAPDGPDAAAARGLLCKSLLMLIKSKRMD
jgi:hypothetical protein